MNFSLLSLFSLLLSTVAIATQLDVHINYHDQQGHIAHHTVIEADNLLAEQIDLANNIKLIFKINNQDVHCVYVQAQLYRDNALIIAPQIVTPYNELAQISVGDGSDITLALKVIASRD